MESYPKLVMNDVKIKVAAAKMGFWIGISDKAKRLEEYANKKATEKQSEILGIAFEVASQVF